MTPDPIFIFNLVTSLCNFGVQGFVLISLFTIAYRRKSNVPFYLAMTSLFLLITLLSMVIAYATGVLLAQEINIILVASLINY